MEKQDFIELQKKVFAAFVEHLKSKNRSFELCSVFVDGKEYKSLHMSDINTTIDGSAKNEGFCFKSGRVSLKAHISLDFCMKSLGNLDEVIFENEDIVLLDYFD